jgi:type IX secretion system PorP/SprF family membrane protein
VETLHWFIDEKKKQMRKTKHKIGVLLLVLFSFAGAAQDVHFSQFYETPQLINPALTGDFNGDIRAIINYREQWKAIGNPFQTSMFSFDAGVIKKKWARAVLNAGIMAYNDKAGASQFGTTQVNVSVSARVAVSEKHKISAGLQGGFAQKGIGNSELSWSNQFNGDAYDPNISSGEEALLNTEPFFYGDFATGLSWSFVNKPKNMASNDKITANAGVALFHVNKPKQEFYFDELENLYSKMVIHGKTSIGLRGVNMAIIPSFYMAIQNTAKEINAGGFVKYRLKEESKHTGLIKEAAIYLGGHYRVGDAFIPSLFLDVANFSLGVSYDLNVSGLKEVTQGNGGIEISLRYINPNPYKGGGGAMF